MTFKDDLVSARDSIVSTSFTVRSGNVVPTTSTVGYDEAVKLAATYLYADMADSSGLVALSPAETVGKVLRLYLDLSVRIIRHHNGHIRSFDGDRVMGIFIGDKRFDAAVKTAMQIKWACSNVIQPKIEVKYKSIRDGGWVIKTGCGIASGDALIVRGGVRKSSNDLVSVGVAPNLAAKLSDVRKDPYHIRIGAGTYGSLSDNTRLSKGVNMWEGTYQQAMGGKSYSYYRSSYHWSVS
jgi:class 3 adenylate cyclase